MEIVYGFLALVPHFLYVILAIWSVIYVFLRMRLLKYRAFIPVSIITITILLLFVFPYTSLYKSLFFAINRVQLKKTVQLVSSNEIRNYQIDTNKYMVPYRLTSHTGVMNVQKTDGVTKVLFYAYDGFFGDVVLVYSSDDSEIQQRDFSYDFPGAMTWNFTNITKLDTYWYYAAIPPDSYNSH